MNKFTALDLAARFQINLTRDFHALPAGQVDHILEAADAYKYRKPRNANGSRARYFHAFLRRVVARS